MGGSTCFGGQARGAALPAVGDEFLDGGHIDVALGALGDADALRGVGVHVDALLGKVGGWVGEKMEEEEQAVGMRCCRDCMGGWVGRKGACMGGWEDVP